jgi:SPP1 gp7 family putative phage head morphogenesis protein
MQKKLITAIIKSGIQDKKTANKLIDEFIKAQGTMASEHLEEFLSSLLVYINKNYSDLDKETLLPLINSKLQDLNIPINTNDVETIYTKLAATHILSAKFEFNKVDVKAIESMRKGFYWAGVEYNEKTQDKLKDIIEGAFKGEYSRADLSAKLKEEFTEVLNASTNYFELVADNVINQSQNISKVNQALKYDVKHFKVVARIDDKTSQVCRSMHGKIIEASHLSNQVGNVLAAKNISEKKAAAAWMSKPVYGKLPTNLGLPPYHGRCRTEVVPVWLSEEEIDGKTVKFANKSKDDELAHIDKTGVQRKLKKRNTHVQSKHKEAAKKDIISALNSITEIAPHSSVHGRTVAKSANGFFMAFDADEIVTMFKPTNLKDTNALNSYFKAHANLDKKEVIKWKKEDSILKFLNGLKIGG